MGVQPRDTDASALANPFAATNGWAYNVDPNGLSGNFAISEFMAANANGIRDEDGDHSDWIEVGNFGTVQGTWPVIS